MSSEEIRKKFLKFFEERGHVIVPSSSLVPANDPSVLFTTAGMQQFKPYFLGKADAKKDFGSLNTVSIQKCIRTSDIDEIGDDTHLTFFEMLGNFSFGGYWKKEAIEYAYDFTVKEMGLKIDYVTVFEGDNVVSADIESEGIWKSIDPNLVVKKFGKADNFWGPTGEEGPCGPTTEIYVDGVEIWNIVFNEFYKTRKGSYEPLEIRGIDTGMGLERLLVQIQKRKNVFETDLFNFANNPQQKKERIVADHVRAVVYLIKDGIEPSNTERGYVLRRLIRRAVVNQKGKNEVERLAERLTEDGRILEVLRGEIDKFSQTLEAGLKLFEMGVIDPFILFSTYGFPIELTEEMANEKGIKIDKRKFVEDFAQHQEISRAGVVQKFKGGLAGHSDMEVKYHTATHLLHQALREVLGDTVFQKGSNITPERLRFDFSFPRKMTEEEKNNVENLVNAKIAEALPVSHEDIAMEEAKKRGALGLFEEKYGDKVRVYKIGPSTGSGQAFSLEFCGGPHVKNTEILGKFKITKEEAVAQGIRRIKAVLN